MQTAESKLFIRQCLSALETLAPEVKQAILNPSNRVSLTRLQRELVKNGLQPYRGQLGVTLNIWQYTLFKEACFVLDGKDWPLFPLMIDMELDSQETKTASPSNSIINVSYLGKGAFAKVYRLDVGSKQFALKRVQSRQKLPTQIIEATSLRAINEHAPAQTFFPRLFDYWIFEGRICLLTDYCGKPLKELPKRFIREQPLFFLDITSQLIAGLQALHRINYVHRDVKLGNLLYCISPGSKRVILKLIDFGLCIDTSVKYKFQFGGTPSYLARWIWRSRPSEANRQPTAPSRQQLVDADIWAGFIALYALLTNCRSPLHKFTKETDEWHKFITNSSDDNWATKLALTTPTYPVPEFSRWIVDNLNNPRTQPDSQQLMLDIKQFIPLFARFARASSKSPTSASPTETLSSS